jgi:hypothetical protein
MSLHGFIFDLAGFWVSLPSRHRRPRQRERRTYFLIFSVPGQRKCKARDVASTGIGHRSRVARAFGAGRRVGCSAGNKFGSKVFNKFGSSAGLRFSRRQ